MRTIERHASDNAILAEHGIETIEQLAEASLDDISDWLDLSVDDAQDLLEMAVAITEARRKRAEEEAEASEDVPLVDYAGETFEAGGETAGGAESAESSEVAASDEEEGVGPDGAGPDGAGEDSVGEELEADLKTPDAAHE